MKMCIKYCVVNGSEAENSAVHSGTAEPIQYERAPLRVRCAMLRKHPPESPVLSCLSCLKQK